MGREEPFLDHQRESAAIFAAFVLAAAWSAHAAFAISGATAETLRLVEKSESRLAAVRNVIENRDAYADKIRTDASLAAVVEKAFENATAYENGVLVAGSLDLSAFPKDERTFHSSKSVFVVERFESGGKSFEIAVESENPGSASRTLSEIAAFALFSLPFFVPLYFL